MRSRGGGGIGSRTSPGRTPQLKAPSPKYRDLNGTRSPPDIIKGAPKTNDLAQRLCRNVLIYGSCRFEDKGCIYSHAPPAQTTTPDMHAILNSQQTEPTGFTRPMIPSSTLTFSTEHLAAPAFVPRSISTPVATQIEETVQTSSDSAYLDQSNVNLLSNSIDPSALPAAETRTLNHHLYSTPLPHTSNLPNSHLPLHSFFIADDLRLAMHERAEAKMQTDQARDAALPNEIHVYHSLHLLSATSTPQERSPRVFGFLTDVYRATCRLDGRLYCLRRIQGFKLAKEAAFGVLDKWRRIRHPNIVSVREAFTTRLFSDSSVVFAYDFHPASKTLFEAHLSAPTLNGAPQAIPERTLWSYIAQIANGLKAIHTAGLAARIIEPTKIILTGKNRLRLNCCSIFDVLTFDHANANVLFQQQDDLLNFGKLLVALCCGTTAAVHNLPASLEIVIQSYSPDVKLVIMYLLGKPGPGKCIDDILVMLGPRLLNEFDAMQNYADTLESGLEAEIENGRVARLMTKLGFINERPEFQMDPRWSETGDRYVLKLFRDYVFHSVDEMGAPVLDMTHVLTALNKVDAELDEKVMLVARDEQSCIIISYGEIKQCIQSAYSELAQASVSSVA